MRECAYWGMPGAAVTLEIADRNESIESRFNFHIS